MEHEALSVSNVSLTYDGEKRVSALNEITLKVMEGEFVAILGPSGCGKSSLLHLIAGFLQPSSGTCLFFGKPISKPSQDRGILFQYRSLFPWKTALGNIMYALRCKGVDGHEANAQSMNWLNRTGLKGFEHFYPGQLSGGMQQRVALARIFAASPKLFLMDEPFGGLDAYTKVQMQEMFLRIWDRYRHTVIFVTHDIQEAILLADRVLIMSARPGTFIEEFKVPLGRPRVTDDLFLPEIMAIRQHVFSVMRDQSTEK